jgi:hypothetical protein
LSVENIMRSQQFVSSTAAVLGVLVFTLLAAATHSAAAGRPSAAASFASHDKTGCISSEVAVFVRKGSDNRERLELRILQADECNDVALANVESTVNLPAGALRVAPDLSFATLNTSVRVTDRQSRREVTATIRLTWKATEKAVTALRSDEPSGLGKFIRMKQAARRSLRLANASGVVSLPGINMTLPAAESAWIGNAEGGVPAGP